MATTRVIDIISRVEDISQDSGVRWPRLELQRWLNEAYLSILLARPDANAVTGTFTCAAGPRQSLLAQFPAGLRLLDVVRNLAATSSKRAVRKIDRRILDDQRPEWYAESETDDVQHWMFDPRQPKEFMVYPPASTDAELEIVYTASVGEHTLTESQLDPDNSNAATILVDDLYAGALIDWILYRAYSKDADYAKNAERANAHMQAFTAILGVKATADAGADPVTPSTVT